MSLIIPSSINELSQEFQARALDILNEAEEEDEYASNETLSRWIAEAFSKFLVEISDEEDDDVPQGWLDPDDEE